MIKLLTTSIALVAILTVADAFTSKSNAAPMQLSCTVSGVAVFENRIHVRCATPVFGFSFFAVATADSPNAARFSTIFNAARINNRPLTILFDPLDLSGSAFGCLNSDCRVARGAEMF
jgi:hypothetical protein